MDLINQCFPEPYSMSYVSEIYNRYRFYSTIVEVDNKQAGFMINKKMLDDKGKWGLDL